MGSVIGGFRLGRAEKRKNLTDRSKNSLGGFIGGRGLPMTPRGGSLGCLVVIGSGGVLERGFVPHVTGREAQTFGTAF